jgi:N-acetylmuramoyl-L-alanine amidase
VGYYIKRCCPHVRVIYTRTTDKFVPLYERAEIANRNHADLFISIHVNSSPNHSIHGASTYVMGLSKDKDNLRVAMTENKVILKEKNYKKHYGNFDINSPEAYIILSMYQNMYLDYSLKFAQLVQDQFRLRAKRKDMGVHQAGFLVLWRTTMPSVLIEVGYISNPAEERFLNTKYGQDIIASAIYRAFKQYKFSFER